MDKEHPNVEYDSKEDFILVTDPRKPSYDDLIGEADKLIRLSKLHNCKRILVDSTNVRSYPNLFDLFKFMLDLSKRSEMKKLKIAVVSFKSVSAPNRFMQSVAANRGFNFKIFDNFELAKEYLLS